MKTAENKSGSILTAGLDQSGEVASVAYEHIIQRMDDAQRSIEIHMYVWRADEVGCKIAQAVLSAAERGVAVKIIKDSGASLFETQEDNRKPMFPKSQSLFEKVTQRCMGMTLPNSYCEDEWDRSLGSKLLEHENVSFTWVSATHTKYYCIDEEILITGSLNCERRHLNYHDVMVELRGVEVVKQFRIAQEKCSAVAQGENLSFYINRPELDAFPVKQEIISMIESAKYSIHLEMAYIGDLEVSSAVKAAAQRGVKVSILFSRKANIGNDINYHTLLEWMREAPVRVRLSDKMIHSKLVLVDKDVAMFGSANLSIFSMQKAGETNVKVENAALVEEFYQVAEERWSEGEEYRLMLDGEPQYSKIMARLQQRHQLMSSHK